MPTAPRLAGRKRPQEAGRGDQHLGSRVGPRDRELREPAAHRGLDPLRVPAERPEPMTAASRAPLGQGLGARAERAAEEPLLAGIGERDAAVRAPEDVAALDAEQRGGAPGHDEGGLAACPRRVLDGARERQGERVISQNAARVAGHDLRPRVGVLGAPSDTAGRRRATSSPPRAWRTAAGGGCPRSRPAARAARASGCEGRRAACERDRARRAGRGSRAAAAARGAPSACPRRCGRGRGPPRATPCAERMATRRCRAARPRAVRPIAPPPLGRARSRAPRPSPAAR